MAEKEPFAYQAAKASWLAPLIAFGLGFFVNLTMQGDERTNLATKQVVVLVSGALGVAIVLIGLVFALYALFNVGKYGAKGLVVPAVVGLLLCAGYLFLLVSAVQVAREVAKKVAASRP